MATTPKKSPASSAAAAQLKKKRSPLALVGALLLVAAVCGAVAAGFVFSGGSTGESTVAKVSAGLDPARAAAAPAKHESGEADFECGKKCKAGGDEVCGTDGKTYLNECFFQNAKCKNASLDKVADWKGYNCPNTCKKQIACKEIGKYLCASDNNVYFGYCNLFVAQCLDPSVQEIECDKSIFDGVFGH